MKYKRSTYSFCSQASNLKSRSEDIMLLQKKMNVVLMIFINNKVQVQKLMEKKHSKGTDFTNSPVPRLL